MDWAALRVTHQRAVLVKSWDVHLDRARLPVSFTLNTAAGLDYQGAWPPQPAPVRQTAPLSSPTCPPTPPISHDLASQIYVARWQAPLAGLWLVTACG